jgi:tRNA-modifying protein YgfZ
MQDWLTAQGGDPELETFGDLAAERAALKSGCALWTRPGWHVHALRGDKRIDFLHSYITQEVRRDSGQAAYGCLLTVKGGLVADLWSLICDDELLLVSAPLAGPSAVKHLKRYALLARVALADLSETRRLLSLLGPQASELAGSLGPLPEADLQHTTGSGDASEVRILRNDWLGVPGYDLLVPTSQAESIGRRLRDAGATLVGEAAIRAQRVEVGIPIYGVDMHEKTLPLEAGLEERAINYDKGCYTGQEVVVRIKHRGKINRHLRGISLEELPSELPQPLFNETGKEVSALTSAVDAAGKAHGLAIVHRKYPPGTTLHLGASDGPPVEVCELPLTSRA